MNFIVPPGGFAGFSQMTPASRARLAQGRGLASGGRRRRKAKASRKRTSSRKRKSSSRRMKFGSPAWQKKYKVGRFARRRK